MSFDIKISTNSLRQFLAAGKVAALLLSVELVWKSCSLCRIFLKTTQCLSETKSRPMHLAVICRVSGATVFSAPSALATRLKDDLCFRLLLGPECGSVDSFSRRSLSVRTVSTITQLPCFQIVKELAAFFSLFQVNV